VQRHLRQKLVCRLGPARCASYMRSDFLMSSTFFRFFSHIPHACGIKRKCNSWWRRSVLPIFAAQKSHAGKNAHSVNHFLTLFRLGLTKHGWPATLLLPDIFRRHWEDGTRKPARLCRMHDVAEVRGHPI